MQREVIPIFEKNPTMFYFGLFSTHVPYIIIGIFYSIYLITFACVKLNPEQEAYNPNSCDVKSITLENIRDEKSSCHKDAFYTDFIFTEPQEKVLPVIHVLVTLKYEIRDFSLEKQCLFFKLFPNPPPVLFS